MNADDIGKILDELGRRLGPAGSHVFELAVREQIIRGATWLVVFVVGLALCLYARKAWIADWQGSGLSARGTLFMAGAFMVFVATIGLIAGGIGQLLNPEYAAIKDILGHINGTAR